MNERKLASYWVRGVRNDGVKFWHLSDDAPEWLKDAVREAHSGGSDLPNDWTYDECRAACEAIDERAADDPDDDSGWVHEHADGRVDVYARDLYQWAADMCLSDVWADAEAEADDLGDGGTAFERLQRIQYCAIEAITQTMLSAWREARDEEAES